MSGDMQACTTCRARQRVHTGLMACTTPHAARLPCAPSASYVELGRDLAAMPQRCRAYTAKPTAKAGFRQTQLAEEHETA